MVPVYASYHCFLRELAAALVKEGWEVCVVCDLSATMGQERAEVVEPRLRFFNLTFPRGANPVAHIAAAMRLRKLVRELRPTLIHAHFSTGIFTTALAVRKGDPWSVIGTFQGLQFPLTRGFRRWLYREAEARASRRLQGVWVLTEDDLNALLEAGVKNAHFQQGFGFGCRIDVFDPTKFSEEERIRLRQSYNIQPDNMVFVFIGRNVAFKGFHLVVTAFFHLLKSEPKARLLIIGDRDPFHPTGLTAADEEKMAKTPEIIQCGWQKNVAPFLAISNALVHPSTREGMPVGCMEALAMGLPIIAPDGRGMRELLSLAGLKPLRELSTDSLYLEMKNSRSLSDEIDRVLVSKVRRLLDRKRYLLGQIEIYDYSLGCRW